MPRFSDMLCRQHLQCGKIEILNKVSRHKRTQKTLHHLFFGEKALVDRIAPDANLLAGSNAVCFFLHGVTIGASPEHSKSEGVSSAQRYSHRLPQALLSRRERKHRHGTCRCCCRQALLCQHSGLVVAPQAQWLRQIQSHAQATGSTPAFTVTEGRLAINVPLTVPLNRRPSTVPSFRKVSQHWLSVDWQLAAQSPPRPAAQQRQVRMPASCQQKATRSRQDPARHRRSR